MVIYATGVLQIFIKDADMKKKKDAHMNWLPDLTLIMLLISSLSFLVYVMMV